MLNPNQLYGRAPLIDGRPAIVLQLNTPNQLFDERDPSPFRERDLDDDAVRYLTSSFLELPGRTDKAFIALYFNTMANFDANTIRNGIQSHFLYEAELKRRELKQAFSQGFLSLVIGITFLFLCTYGVRLLGQNSENPFHSLAHEGLFIMGWVAMWKPINTFLYEWWPVRTSERILREIAELEIRVSLLHEAQAKSPSEAKPDLRPKILLDEFKATS